MNFYAQNARKEKVVNTAESESLGRGEERLSGEERRRRLRLGSLGGEIVC